MTASFSENLERLDGLLKRLEAEEMPLDEALEVFEEGVALVRENQDLLDRAEQRVTLLTEEGEAAFGERYSENWSED